MSRHLWQTIGLIIGLVITPALYADAAAEREALARILYELQAIEPLINKAQAQTDKDARIQFRYNWLRQDLNQIKDGIQSHIDAPRAEPRTFPPLRGDYRR